MSMAVTATKQAPSPRPFAKPDDSQVAGLAMNAIRNFGAVGKYARHSLDNSRNQNATHALAILGSHLSESFVSLAKLNLSESLTAPSAAFTDRQATASGVLHHAKTTLHDAWSLAGRLEVSRETGTDAVLVAGRAAIANALDGVRIVSQLPGVLVDETQRATQLLERELQRFSDEIQREGIEPSAVKRTYGLSSTI